MIKRLLRSGLTLLIYFCLATVIAQAALLGYLGYSWNVSRDKMIQVLAILQDIDLFAMKDRAVRAQEDDSTEQVSWDDIAKARALEDHSLQLREGALEDGLSQLASEERKLGAEKKRFNRVKDQFIAVLEERQTGAIAQGREDVIQKMITIKPPQAKEFLIAMLKDDKEDEVVALLSGMPNLNAAKIITEFQTAAEIEQMYRVLEKIGLGFPNAELAAQTQEQLAEPNPGGGTE